MIPMDMIDLTHPLEENMPVYPGTEQPLFLVGNSIEEHGFAEKKITMFSHTGTHMDAPAHLIEGAPYLDYFPVEKFTGKACCLDCRNSENGIIDLDRFQNLTYLLEQCDFLLIRTGWEEYWGTDQYFSAFPVLSPKAALWLSKIPLKGIGIDAISVDPVNTSDFAIHKTLMKKNFVIIENLKNLHQLPEYGFRFSAFPLKIYKADGSPVRAVATRN